ncbi:protein SMG9 isoform X3 [Cephus cinctus]|uniref:Protein SMG9 isoform X3 n=1 Tax=Cephus cinctus TaxID=211228 RepID=A0AAJ7RE77_CEPCN|nr:protein SMG9 isoform X3 [Cephus cinctus]
MNSRKTIPIMSKDMDVKDNESRALIKVVDRPTFILKTREGESRAVSPSQRNGTKPDIFPVQNLSHHENGSNCTSGIDFYVTKNRVIYLDTQPILSGFLMDHSGSFDQKKVSNDFASSESNLELQSLQFAAFLFSVCHVVIFVQDWFVDPNLIRFLQTAEMLKPSSTTMDQDYIEYYPHLLFLHNKSELQDFMPSMTETMKEFYNKVFATSRLQTHSSIDMSSFSVEGQLNLFLIPDMTTEDEPSLRENETKLIEKLRMKIHGVSRNSMTPTALTEKNWYHYASKVMDAIKKSHLFSEYGRLMP